MLRMRDSTHPGVPLLPKLRGNFAEFLNMGYLERLGILYLPTCVGLRYGHPVIYLEDFLVSVELLASVPFDLGIVSRS